MRGGGIGRLIFLTDEIFVSTEELIRNMSWALSSSTALMCIKTWAGGGVMTCVSGDTGQGRGGEGKFTAIQNTDPSPVW